MDFAGKLSALMEERGLGVRALARRVPCDPALVSRLVNRRQKPSAQIGALLDEALTAGGDLIRAAAASRESPADPGRRLVDGGDVLAAFGMSASPTLAGYGSRPVAPELVGYFRSQLAGHYQADMFLGPHYLIPTVAEQYRLINTLVDSAAPAIRAQLLGVGTAYAALIGWLHQDAGNVPQSAYWRSATLDMAHRCENPDLISYALTNKAMLATDAGNGQAVIDFGNAALLGRQRQLMPKTQIMAAVQTAHGYSLTGDRPAADRLLDGAARQVTLVGDDQVWGNACNRTPHYFEVQRATCYGRLGADDEAARLWGEILDAMPSSGRRDTGVFRARQAAALAGSGEPEQVKAITEDVVSLVRETGSARLRAELLTIPARMSAWADTPAGRDVSAVLATIR